MTTWALSGRPKLAESGMAVPEEGRPARVAFTPLRRPGCRHDQEIIACKGDDRARLWARTTSDYGNTFTRIRDAVAALPVESAALDGEAIVLRPDNSSDFEALKSRHGQAEAILVAYDIMEHDGQDIRPEPLEERRKQLVEAAMPQHHGDRPRHPIERGDHRRWSRHFPARVLDGASKASSRSELGRAMSAAEHGHG